MPTGIEETLGAIAAFIAENAALSAFSGSANPNGAGVEAGDSAAFAPSPILDVDVQEGASGTVAVAEAPVDGSGGDSGASRAPVDGDHPPPSGGVYERPAILDGQQGTEYIFTDPMVVDAGPDPADVPAPAPAADGAPTPAPNRAETGVPPPPASDPPWLPAMNIVPPGPAPSFTAPPMTPAATAPGDDGGGIGVPADWADAWERNHEYSWSKLLF